MTSNGFKKAERKQSWLNLAIVGPSGSGKTFSALKIAVGIGGRIAVIDTENGSAALYSGLFEFDVLELKPPFTVKSYNQAIRMAAENAYDVLIIDSLTHAWAGDGGLLDKKATLDEDRTKNSFSNWQSITKDHESFKSAFLFANLHVIATIRSKQGYVLEVNDKGKQVPKKVGMEPIQRDGIEYEFTTVFELDMKNRASVSKDRSGLFEDFSGKLTEKVGKQLIEWRNSGKAIEEPPAMKYSDLADAFNKLGITNERLIKFCGVTTWDDINDEHVEDLRNIYPDLKKKPESIKEMFP